MEVNESEHKALATIRQVIRSWKKRRDAADRRHWEEIDRAREDNRLWRSSQEWPR